MSPSLALVVFPAIEITKVSLFMVFPSSLAQVVFPALEVSKVSLFIVGCDVSKLPATLFGVDAAIIIVFDFFYICFVISVDKCIVFFVSSCIFNDLNEVSYISISFPCISSDAIDVHCIFMSSIYIWLHEFMDCS